MTRIGATGFIPVPGLQGAGGLGGQQTSPTVIGSICDISDVDCTYLAEGDVLQWNGSAWIPLTVTVDPVDDTAVWLPLTTVVSGDPVLVWDGDDGLIPTLIPF